MKIPSHGWLLIAALLSMGLSSTATAQGPSAADALRLVPRQKGVEFDQPSPEEAQKCTMSITEDRRGYVVQDPGGKTLRMFLDTDGDGTVDQWRYYKNGLEVYRDIDTNRDRSADQFRWFHSGGSRWGIDRDGDGVIDEWKSISAEEVTAEVVAALGRRDVQRFLRVALSDEELRSLRLGEELTERIAEETDNLAARFQQLAASQKVVSPETEWVQFSGNRPGLIPEGRDGAARDVQFYSNAIAFVKNGDKHDQVVIGNLIRFGDGWRVLGLPEVGDNVAKADILGGAEAIAQAQTQPTAPVGGPTEEQQKLIEQLQAIDDAIPQANDPAQRARLHAQRAALVNRIAEVSTSREERDMWLRQMADMVSAAAQYGEYPGGADVLKQLVASLGRDDVALAAYIEYRRLGADYGLKLVGGVPDFMKGNEPDYEKIQADWIQNLEAFVKLFPASPEAADAMLQLGNNYEFAGQPEEAITWYDQIIKDFPNLSVAQTAAGAKVRLTSEGKPIAFRGKTTQGQSVDLANYRGRVVLIQYWASWCEPCKADIAVLKELISRYGQDKVSVISVNLDSTVDAMNAFLTQHTLPWANIREDGGFSSEPATQLGVLHVPTMILVDQQGRLVTSSLRTADIDRQVSQLLK